MTPWLEDIFLKYQWIWLGITFGFAAKYALLIKRGVRIRPSLVLADILLLPLVALIAFAGVQQLGIVGETAALLTALSTVGADRLVKLLTDRFFRQVESEIEEMAKRVKGTVRQEVQTELSGRHIIDDTIEGRAPDDYVALHPRPSPPFHPGDDEI